MSKKGVTKLAYIRPRKMIQQNSSQQKIIDQEVKSMAKENNVLQFDILISKYNNFHNGSYGLRILKKRLRNLTNQQQNIFKQNIQILIKFFIQKKNYNLNTTMMALQQFSNVINVYESTPWPMNFNNQMINKIRYCFQEIQENTQRYGVMVMFDSVRKQYQNLINPLLYLIIVLIAKAQKEKQQPYFYKNHLNQILTKKIRNIILDLPLFQQERNLRFLAVIIGHIGELYPIQGNSNKKTLQKRVFKIFQRLIHSKNLYYLANFLRQRLHDFKFKNFDANPSIIIRKMKQLIKQRFESYQIATLLDLYNKMMIDNKEYMNQFYDQQIFNFTLDVNSGMRIKFPTSSYKMIYFGASRKHNILILKSQQYKSQQNYEQFSNFRIIQFCEFITVSDLYLQQYCIMVENLFTYLSKQSMYSLIGIGFIDRLICFFRNNNYSIIISGLNILKCLYGKTLEIQNQKKIYGITRILYNKVITHLDQLCTVANQFAVCQLAKEVRVLLQSSQQNGNMQLE